MIVGWYDAAEYHGYVWPMQRFEVRYGHGHQSVVGAGHR